LHFRLYPLRFSFLARESIHFPPGKSANILRGAFGTIFRRIACVPQCESARTCELRASCPYALMFEPSALGEGPSGLTDWPRPFVFRASHLDGSIVEPGTAFSFDLNLFDMRNPAIAYLVLAFAQLAREGLGPRRGRADLVSVWRLNEAGEPAGQVFNGSTLLECATKAMQVDLEPSAALVDRVRVRFVTPTELKSEHRVAERPEFGILFGRLRDRISTLRTLYGDGPLDIDFRAIGERAAAVRILRCELQRIAADRLSSRTGQRHSLGGFVGEVEYQGKLSEFMPYLHLGKWIGVGRQTVWGKGMLTASVMSFPDAKGTF